MFGLRLCTCVDIKAKNLFHCDHGDIIYNFGFLYYRQEPGKVLKGRETLASLKYDPRQQVHQVKDEESARQLIEVLGGANPTCGFMKYNKPVANIPVDTASSLHTQEIVYTAKHFLDFDLPASIFDIKSACMFFKDSLNLDPNGIAELEMRTRG